MTSDIVYGVQVEGQEFTIRLTPPKGKRHYRGYLTDALNRGIGSGRWNTAEEADQALKDIAQKALEKLCIDSASNRR